MITNLDEFVPLMSKAEIDHLTLPEKEQLNRRINQLVKVLPSFLPGFVAKQRKGADGISIVSLFYNRYFTPKRAMGAFKNPPDFTLSYVRKISNQINGFRGITKKFEKENELMKRFPNLYVAFDLYTESTVLIYKAQYQGGFVYGTTYLDYVVLSGSERDFEKLTELNQIAGCLACGETSPTFSGCLF